MDESIAAESQKKIETMKQYAANESILGKENVTAWRKKRMMC